MAFYSGSINLGHNKKNTKTGSYETIQQLTARVEALEKITKKDEAVTPAYSIRSIKKYGLVYVSLSQMIIDNSKAANFSYGTSLPTPYISDGIYISPVANDAKQTATARSDGRYFWLNGNGNLYVYSKQKIAAGNEPYYYGSGVYVSSN